jgi:hypothetical protein
LLPLQHQLLRLPCLPLLLLLSIRPRQLTLTAVQPSSSCSPIPLLPKPHEKLQLPSSDDAGTLLI